MKPLSHLDRLEAESLHIFREVASEFTNPVLLYSIGKDSTVLLHLMRKAFFPARPPIPLLHIDSTFEFRDTYAFRDQVPERCNVDLRVYINQEGVRQGINPFDHGATVYTDIMRTQALREALEQGGYDCAIGGARRDSVVAQNYSGNNTNNTLADYPANWDGHTIYYRPIGMI